MEVLVEVAGDLGALYEHFRRSGLSERQAARRAAARVVPSAWTTARLSHLHGDPYRTLLRRLGRPTGRLVDAALIASSAAALIGYGAFIAWRSGAFLGAGPALWALLGLGAGTILYALGSGHGLFVRRELPCRFDHAAVMLGLGGASILVGATGALLAFQNTAARAARGELHGAEIVGRIGQHALLLSTGLAIALAALVLGFLFAGRVAAMRRAELEYLLED